MDILKESFVSLSLSSKSIKDVAKKFLDTSKDGSNTEQLWFESFKQAKHASNQLALFYVLHETVIHCKDEKEMKFKDSLKSYISESIPCLKSSHVISKIKKLITCWTEKHIFDQEFTQKLLREIFLADKKSLDNRKDMVGLIEDFSPDTLLVKLKEFSEKEGTILNFVELEPPKVDLLVPPEEIVANLKARKETQSLYDEIEAYRTELNALLSIYEDRLQHLAALQDSLEIGELFFDIQQKDASVVVNAYSNYQSKVRNNLEQIKKYEMQLPFSTQDSNPTDCSFQSTSKDNLPYVDEFGDVDYRILAKRNPNSNTLNEDDSMDISDEEESSSKDKVLKNDRVILYQMPSPPAPPAELLDSSNAAPEIPSQLLDFIKTLPTTQTKDESNSIVNNGPVIPFPNRIEMEESMRDFEQSSGSGTPTQDEVVDRMRDNHRFVTLPTTFFSQRTPPIHNLCMPPPRLTASQQSTRMCFNASQSDFNFARSPQIQRQNLAPPFNAVPLDAMKPANFQPQTYFHG